MAFIKEPKNIDLTIKSEPWTDEELVEFRKLIKKQKQKSARRKMRLTSKPVKK